MTAWDAIRSRRDVREFDGRAIADADLDQILEAGRRSPSSRNWQAWDFIVATDRQQLARQVLGFPEDKTSGFLITLGYPAGRPLAPIRHPDRRPLDEVVHRGR